MQVGNVSSSPSAMPPPRSRRSLQPVWVRIAHWFNALAVIIMILSGWRIYDASPIFEAIHFPTRITLGGWLGGALQWHFAAMWLLCGNAVFYAAASLITGRVKRRFFPLSVKSVVHDFVAALKGRLSHDDLSHYNAVQKALYLTTLFDIVLLIVSGLTIWKPVQFGTLRMLMGGYDNARIVHFCAMTFLAGFIALHLAMVALVPRSLLTMIRGR